MKHHQTKKLKPFYLLLFCFSLSLICVGQARRSPESTQAYRLKNQQKYWVSAGLGISTYGPAFNSHFVFEQDKHLFTLNLNYTIKPPYSSEYSPSNVTDIGILYGRSFGNSWVLTSVSAGICHVKSDDFIDIYHDFNGHPHDERDIKTAVGFPVHVELLLPQYENIAWGITGFVNLNGIQSLAGATLSMYIGKF